MIHYKDVERRFTEKLPVAITCDICKRFHAGAGWADHSWEIAETRIQMTTGTRHADEDCSKKVSFDICPECFSSKLIPWLESQGATPTIFEQ